MKEKICTIRAGFGTGVPDTVSQYYGLRMACQRSGCDFSMRKSRLRDFDSHLRFAQVPDSIVLINLANTRN